MPQVNEFSWLNFTFNFLLIFFILFLSLSYLILSTNLKHSFLNLIFFSHLL